MSKDRNTIPRFIVGAWLGTFVAALGFIAVGIWAIVQLVQWVITK